MNTQAMIGREGSGYVLRVRYEGMLTSERYGWYPTRWVARRIADDRGWDVVTKWRKDA